MGKGGAGNYMCRSPEGRENPGTPEEVKASPYVCSIECRGKQARGWRSGQELGWGGCGAGGLWSSLHLPKILWLLRGEETGGGRQEEISCLEAVAEPRGDKPSLQEDSGSGVELGRIKISTVSSHSPFTVWLRA